MRRLTRRPSRTSCGESAYDAIRVAYVGYPGQQGTRSARRHVYLLDRADLRPEQRLRSGCAHRPRRGRGGRREAYAQRHRVPNLCRAFAEGAACDARRAQADGLSGREGRKSAADIDSAAVRGLRNSPSTNSRLSSNETRKKNSVISPSFIHALNARATSHADPETELCFSHVQEWMRPW